MQNFHILGNGRYISQMHFHIPSLIYISKKTLVSHLFYFIISFLSSNSFDGEIMIYS